MTWFWLGLMLATLAVCLGCWVAGWPWVAHTARGAHAPPAPFWWPWVQALAPSCAAWVTWPMRRRLQRWGPRAGLSDTWHAEHWLAARLLLAGTGLVLTGGGALLAEQSWRVVTVLAAAGAGVAYLWPDQRLRQRAAVRRQAMLKELPFMLDLMTLCVEAGLSLPAALRQVADHAPAGPLRQSLRDACALERTGVERARWLAQWAEGSDLAGVHSLVLTLAQADRLGMSLGPLLRTQAERQRSERFVRAETLALQAPVKMLFPMVLCIFPCTFLVIGFPVAVKLLDAGL
ncbi:type II secretion system F family protein [Castellaniella sp.]|uniref:type II secretion system F family protein n=1 Tax=Castellaniella sp. TaxID=1955812 RepID=UPI002AFDE0E3|nr:type II secretion system F family protein [Castellaniella sp.]